LKKNKVKLEVGSIFIDEAKLLSALKETWPKQIIGIELYLSSTFGTKLKLDFIFFYIQSSFGTKRTLNA